MLAFHLHENKIIFLWLILVTCGRPHWPHVCTHNIKHILLGQSNPHWSESSWSMSVDQSQHRISGWPKYNPWASSHILPRFRHDQCQSCGPVVPCSSAFWNDYCQSLGPVVPFFRFFGLSPQGFRFPLTRNPPSPAWLGLYFDPVQISFSGWIIKSIIKQHTGLSDSQVKSLARISPLWPYNVCID